MKKNKINKNNRENNIKNQIKSIFLSNRELNPKNVKFNIFKEILLSDNLNELLEKRTFEMRNLIIHYKENINNDDKLNDAQFYFNLVEQIRIKRINDITNTGKINEVISNKMKEQIKDLEIEENWVERGYQTFKVLNSIVQIKIEDSTQLEYIIKLLKTETINGVLIKEKIIEINDLSQFLIDVKKYSLGFYNQNPSLNRNEIFVGENFYQTEIAKLYYCLNDGKIHIINIKKRKSIN